MSEEPIHVTVSSEPSSVGSGDDLISHVLSWRKKRNSGVGRNHLVTDAAAKTLEKSKGPSNPVRERQQNGPDTGFGTASRRLSYSSSRPTDNLEPSSSRNSNNGTDTIVGGLPRSEPSETLVTDGYQRGPARSESLRFSTKHVRVEIFDYGELLRDFCVDYKFEFLKIICECARLADCDCFAFRLHEQTAEFDPDEMIFEVHISSNPSLLRERPGIATGSELRQFLFRWSGFQFEIDEWKRNTPGVFRRSGLGSPTRVYSVIPGLLSDNSLDNVISEDKLSPLPIMPPSIGSHSLGTNLRRSIPQSAATSFATAFTSSVASYHTAGCSSLRSPKSAGTPAMTPWRRFLREQRLLPTPFEEQNWSGRGQHAEFSKAEEHTVPLIPDGRVLGHSASAVVDVVRCRRIALARKTIRCGRRMKREDAIKEVEHLQQLDHAHVVKVIGTYVVENGRDLHILMYPVADRDLDAYMDDDGDGPSPFDRAALERFFVCLASTLAYLHRKLIRHMDIKPKNLLVRHTGNNNNTTTTTTTTTTAYRAGSSAVPTAARIYLADFGIARSYPSALDAETCSPTAYTRIYAAPEVVAQERRGFKADVFSLGCVFAEMLCALAGGRAARDELRVIREGNDGDDDDDDDDEDDCDDGDDGDGDVDGNGADRSFQANVAAVTAYVRGLGLPIGEDGGGGAKARWAAAQCVRMLDPDPDGRPDAEELLPSQAGFECCHAGAERLEATVGK